MPTKNWERMLDMYHNCVERMLDLGFDRETVARVIRHPSQNLFFYDDENE